MVTHLVEAIRAEVQDRYPELKKRVAIWFAYAMMYRPKYTLSHDNDPPWDSSGHLFIKSKVQSNIVYLTAGAPDQEGFDLNSYNNFEEFLEEYTGQSTASFVSGQELFYETYKEELTEEVEKWIDEILIEIFSNIKNREIVFSQCKLSQDILVADLSSMFDFINEVESHLEREFFTELRFEIVYELLPELIKEDIQELFDLGVFPSQLRRQQEIESWRQWQVAEDKARQRARELLAEMTFYLNNLGIELEKAKNVTKVDEPRPINKRSKAWQHVKKWLQQLPEEDRSVILKYGPFSNSIKEGRF